MNISELSVRRPVAMTMVFLLLCVIACVYIPRLGIALFPSTTYPFLSVNTTYTDVGPEEIDQNVTDVIVNRLTRVKGVQKITSTSRSGRSSVFLEFGYDQDMDEAFNDVTSALANISNSLPDNCGTPSIRKFDSDSRAIMRLVIDGDLPLYELKNLAEDIIQPLLERVEGVAATDVMGGRTKEIRIDLQRNRLEAYGLTIPQITAALSARNIQTSSGTMTQQGIDYEIVTSEYYSNLDDIRQTVVALKSGAAITIDDIADVYENYDDNGRDVYINGVPALYISVSNESGSNASAISRGIHEILPEINDRLPKGISVRILSDDATLINSTMNQVYSSGIEGAVLAMLVIFFFLRGIRSALIIGLSMPISILLTLMVMAMMDLTINMMTMSGLILGMGMMVDSSIVILENITLRREKGEPSAIAAILGSRNMLNAIVASTLTTLCVFIPILIYQAELESYGQMFKEMVITICVSLSASLVVAVTLVPALCGSILPINTRTQKPLHNKMLKWIDNQIVRLIDFIEYGYAGVLHFCLHNRFIVLMLVIVMCIVSIQIFLSMGMNIAPSSNADDQVNLSLQMPTGTNNDVVSQYLFDFQEIILSEIGDAYETIVLDTGSSNTGSIQINLPDLSQQKISATEIKSKLQPYLDMWSDVTITFSGNRGPGGSSSAMTIRLISNDNEATKATADEIIALLKEKVPEITEVTTDLENGNPRFQITVNTSAAAAAGVSVKDITNVMKTAVSGSTATTFHANGEDIDIIVSLKETDMLSPTDIGALTVSATNGLMTLDNFISYIETTAPQRIQREDGERISRITARLQEGAVATEVQTQIEQIITDNIVIPDTVELSYSGDAQDIEKFMKALRIVIALAIFLVFAVMAAQFESLIDPLIIFFSIPLLFIGVTAAYLLTDQTVTLYSYVGIVALAGIVVNNGIVLVDFTNQLVKEKIPVFKACILAGRNRLRPILMSTLTTVLGMVPMALFPGEGAESMQPICLTILGGLLSGAFMTLFISPILYTLLNRRRENNFYNPNSLSNQLAVLDEKEARKKAELSTTDMDSSEITEPKINHDHQQDKLSESENIFSCETTTDTFLEEIISIPFSKKKKRIKNKKHNKSDNQALLSIYKKDRH